MRTLNYIRVRAYRRNKILGVILAALVAGVILGAAWTTKQQETYQRYETNSTSKTWNSRLVESR
jgi:hypothetical protein